MRKALLWVFAAIQAGCAVVFLWDLVNTIFGLRSTPLSWQTRELLEIAASLGLMIGAGFGLWAVRNAGRRAKRAENALRVASGAFANVVDERFDDWSLTPAEREVGWLSIKGFSVAEIAELRGTSESTVKVQSTAIYRKAGVNGRAQLLASFVEDLLDGDGIAPEPAAADAPARAATGS